MTENKRFRVTLGNNTVRFVDFEENKQLMSISFKKHNDAVDCQNALKFQCDLLNDLNDENKKLKEGVEELNEICKYYEMRIKELSEQAEAVREELRLCEEENNALQERNDRQYEILRKLYTLIENKDWKGLTAHMEELDKCEEQLRKEWRLYSD